MGLGKIYSNEEFRYLLNLIIAAEIYLGSPLKNTAHHTQSTLINPESSSPPVLR